MLSTSPDVIICVSLIDKLARKLSHARHQCCESVFDSGVNQDQCLDMLPFVGNNVSLYGMYATLSASPGIL